MTKAKLKIGGMHCNGCAAGIDDRLEELDGVRKSSTSFARGRTKVEYDESQIDLDAMRRAISQLGYYPE